MTGRKYTLVLKTYLRRLTSPRAETYNKFKPLLKPKSETSFWKGICVTLWNELFIYIPLMIWLYWTQRTEQSMQESSFTLPTLFFQGSCIIYLLISFGAFTTEAIT